jgi:hypothetical protein
MRKARVAIRVSLRTVAFASHLPQEELAMIGVTASVYEFSFGVR